MGSYGDSVGNPLVGVKAESEKIRSSLHCATVIEVGECGNRETSICFFDCMLIYILLHSIKNLRGFPTMLLGMCPAETEAKNLDQPKLVWFSGLSIGL